MTRPPSLDPTTDPSGDRLETLAVAEPDPAVFPPGRIDTLRLRLRLPRLDDAEAVYRYARDPEVTRFLAFPTHRTEADARRFLEDAVAAAKCRDPLSRLADGFFDLLGIQGLGGGGNAMAGESMGAASVGVSQAPPPITGNPRLDGDFGYGSPGVADLTDLPMPEFNDGEAVQWAVEVHHDRANPLEMSGTPDPAALFTVVDDAADHCPPNALPVTWMEGSVSRPWVNQELVDDALYIDGAPDIGDIQQGYIGDCYFLAALASVVNQDPSRITRDLTRAGDRTAFSFKAFDPPDWVDAPVVTDTRLAQYQDADGNLSGLRAVGVVASPTPLVSRWWVHHDPASATLVLVRDDEHEAAMWVALLE